MLYAGLRAGCGYVLYCCYLHSTALIGAMDVVLLPLTFNMMSTQINFACLGKS